MSEIDWPDGADESGVSVKPTFVVAPAPFVATTDWEPDAPVDELHV